jgi:hypothetical protein
VDRDEYVAALTLYLWYGIFPRMSTAADTSLVTGVKDNLSDRHRQLMLDINSALLRRDEDERTEDVRTGHLGGETGVQSRGSAFK